jgi:enediyne biosynthesis protein E4
VGRVRGPVGAIAALVLLVPGPGARATPHFTNVTSLAGINVSGLGNSSSWIDYDADGDLDLLATTSDLFGKTVYLYRNEGDGAFTDVTTSAGLGNVQIRSVAWGDYDNDGWPDLAVTTYSSNSRTKLYHNGGDGTFTEVGAAAGMRTAGLPWRVAWGDYDRDGFVDLYQANGASDFLYHNNGDGTFTELGQSAGVSGPEFSNAPAWGDYDRDGWPDLFVADDGADHLYRNDADGTFTDVTISAGVGDSAESQSACWGDYDDNGRLDLYVVDIAASHNHLYKSNGDGTFTDVTQSSGTGDVGDGRSCDWLDADNDGRLDLFASDHVHKNKLFRNNGNGTFTDVAATAGIADPFDTFNAAWGDYDGDGDLDVFMVGHVSNVLYSNDGSANGFLELNLVGTTSNRSAIGARAILFLSGRQPNRTVEGASGAYGQDSLTVEFGLGTAPGPFKVRIIWPSGTVQSLSGIQPNTTLQVTEP